jgi:hypothetical protein
MWYLAMNNSRESYGVSMSPNDERRARQILYAVRRIMGSTPEIGVGRAFLIAALVVSKNHNGTTFYHYTAFYNLHHSLKVLLKNVFNITTNEHSLIKSSNRIQSLLLIFLQNMR